MLTRGARATALTSHCLASRAHGLYPRRLCHLRWSVTVLEPEPSTTQVPITSFDVPIMNLDVAFSSLDEAE